MEMNQRRAELLARAVGGEAWRTGGGEWVVTLNRADGVLVVFSSDAVREYDSEAAFDAGRAAATIALEDADSIDSGREFVLTDARGNVFYRDDELEVGWSDEFEAQHQARAWESRGDGRFFVREKGDA